MRPQYNRNTPRDSPAAWTSSAPAMQHLDSILQWTDSDDSIPNRFLVVPLLDNGYPPRWRSAVRFIVPCQGPSLLSRGRDSFHVTGHDGYTIKYPREMEHRHRNGAKATFSGLKILLKLLGMSARAAHLPIPPTEQATSILSSFIATADNKARLDAIGIDPRKFSIQVVKDANQQKEMERLLRMAVSTGQDPSGTQNITGGLKGIDLEDGRTLWICSECQKCLRRRKSVKDYMTLMHYKVLVMGGPDMEVTLCNDLSVSELTRSLSGTSATKLVINIVHGFFERIEKTQDEESRRKAIVELFNQLGQAISRQKELVHLEIHGGGTANGSLYTGKVYTGLNGAFKCRSLKTVRISGIPCLLQDRDVPIKCQDLENLSLHGIPFSANESIDNFHKLIGTNPDLASLTVAASDLSMVKPWMALEQFPKLFSELVHLDLSNNRLTAQVATDFARVTCENGTKKLRSFILSNNVDIGDQGSLDVIAQFWRNHHWLDTLKLEDTSWKCPRTIQSYNEYMDPNKRVREL
ncbi:hypothetical protein B0O80DRAFT_440395 [Mortierella sp. GBAus27b]|nr:hypothetical protein BGX31_008823 [Mortierella sp. GBA43]KAI8359494.1 hypothetical protein B0O80DRAFT_440395 [Mortierella sp. GBAus27b]